MTRRSQIRLWVLDHLPDGVVARPGEWFLALLCLLSGIPIALGVTDASALEEVLPPLLYRAWGVALVVGGTALAIGLASIRLTYPGARYVVLRVPAYRLGLRLLGISSVAYAGAQLIQSGPPGPLVPLLAFAAMCYVRLLTLGGR